MPVYGALDLAAQTGVCHGEPFGKPSFETWKMEGGLGRRGVMMRRQMLDWIERAKPEVIFVEKPLTPAVASSIGVNFETNIALNGYVFLAHSICYAAGIECIMHERQAALLHFTGKRSFRKEVTIDRVTGKRKTITDAAKRACDARCRQMGWQPANFDEADAAALWDYGCASLHQQHFIAKVSADRPMLFGKRKAA